MALTDINFQEGEPMDFVAEIPPLGVLNAPDDIIIESEGPQYLLAEIPAAEGGGGNIFIMSE